MVGWVKYLVYIMSFFIPPVGIITFWIFTGRIEEELRNIARWAFLAAFIGIVVCVIAAIVLWITHPTYWRGMGGW